MHARPRRSVASMLTDNYMGGFLLHRKCCKFRKANEESVKSGGRRVDTAISGG